METEPLIVVVDDDERICRAIQRVLINGGYRVRTFTTAQSYLAEQESMEPACLVIDIKIPDLDGLAMLRESRAAGLETPAVFITGSADLDAAVKAMKLGAFDLLEKPLDDHVLLSTVNNATRRDAEQRAGRRQLAVVWQALETVTAREAEVCALVTSGRLNKQIAAIIGTTEKTVKVHRARAMTKLGAHSVAELVRVVDYLLSPDAPATIVTADHRVLQRPRVLDIMATALGRANAAPDSVTSHTESIRAHSTGSSDSGDRLPAS
jgi:FixJ family two-component response regulator